MKAFQDLKIIGSDSDQERLIERLDQMLDDGWTRSRDKEAESKQHTGIGYIIFVCSKTDLRPSAVVALTKDENNYLYVANIVPTEIGKLTKDQYNSILQEFLARFVEPSAIGLDIEIRTTRDEITIDNSMSPEMALRLKRFSHAANKADGGTHPYDRERFFDFIIQSHEESSLLSETTLKGLLIDDGWIEESAFELSCEYNFGRELLNRYSENAQD